MVSICIWKKENTGGHKELEGKTGSSVMAEGSSGAYVQSLLLSAQVVMVYLLPPFLSVLYH